MSSKKRQEASRRNGKKSGGPKTEKGRRISSRNSLTHGLSVPITSDPLLSSRAERLAQLIAGPDSGEHRLENARIIAEAQIDLQRIRRLRLERLAHPSLVNKPITLKELRSIIRFVEEHVRDEWEQISIVDEAVEDILPETEPPLEEKIDSVIRSFHRLDRYERRALSKRKFAIRRLNQIDN